MAILTNTFLTFSAIGNKEDLSKMIYNISPTQTPFIGAIAKVKASAVLHEWQTDAIETAAANAQIEGDDPTVSNGFAAAVPTARLNNRCQISSKTVVVSGTQDAVEKAGREREIVYQTALKAKALKRDIEFVATNNQAPVTGNSTTARQLRPLVGWYTTNTVANGGSNGSTSAARSDGTQRAFTETLVKTGLQAAWTAGGDIDLIMLGAFNKTVFSTFTGNASRMDKSEDRRVVATTDIYESDFGKHKVVANRFSRSRDCHLLDTSMWALAYLRPMKTIDLAKTGDNEKGYMRVEYTLEGRNEAASCLVADLTTS